MRRIMWCLRWMSPLVGVVMVALLSTGLSQMVLVTIKNDFDDDLFHFQLLSPKSFVFKALYGEDTWAGRFQGKDIVKDFINMQDEKACAPFSDKRRAQVKGRVALIERGGCTFFLKGHHCADAGAYACLIFDPEVNEDTSDVEMFIRMPAGDEDIAEKGPVDIPVAYVRRQDALYIRQMIHEDAVTGIQLNLNRSSFSVQDQPTWTLW